MCLYFSMSVRGVTRQWYYGVIWRTSPIRDTRQSRTTVTRSSAVTHIQLRPPVTTFLASDFLFPFCPRFRLPTFRSAAMSQPVITPFDTIESAHDFVRVLAETIAEARQEIDCDLERESGSQTARRQDALRIAAYNLSKLENHMKSSRRILNDLRSLRRLLFAERAFHRVRAVPEPAKPAADQTPSLIVAIPGPRTLDATVLPAPSSGRQATAA